MFIQQFKNIGLLFVVLVLCQPNTATAQNQDEESRVIMTALPFLRITPDARFSAMGDAGIALAPDANSLHYNASNLVFSEYDFGISTSYTSWLRSLGVNDVFLGYLSGYKHLGSQQTLGFGLRYFSAGQLQYTDEQGQALQTVKPHELAVDFAYARKLGKHVSLGLTLRYLLSNLGNGVTPAGATLRPAHGFATDLSFTYRKPLKIGKYEHLLSVGAAISNLGTKISYTQSAQKDYLPSNLGIGLAWEWTIDKHNSITFATDLNKLMVPSPVSPYIEDENGQLVANPAYDADADGFADYRQQPLMTGLFASFGDAQGGIREELNELMCSFGIEYWYNKQFAVRAGYYHEHRTKGNRKFFTVGLGVRYNVLSFNFSYLIPTVMGQRSPLDHTLRFSLMFDFNQKPKDAPF